MKKKVLHIVEAFGGGIFSFLVDLINATCDEYDIILACSIRPQTPENYAIYFKENVNIIELTNGNRDINLLNDFKFYREVQSIIKSEQPDIVHLHSSKAGFIGRLAIRSDKIKVIYNPHGFSFLKEDESKFKKLIFKELERFAAKQCGSIIGVSEGEYREALKLSSKAYLINNGIDINKLPCSSKQIESSKKLKVCTIGRICFQKNPMLFNEIAKKFPELEFTWIGDGELRGELTSCNIKITGWMSKKEVINILNESDVFLLPSLWEGLPIALLEAMYYKKICVVSNVIGNRDVIKSNINGFVGQNLNDFIEIITVILNKQVDMKIIKTNAYKDVCEKYNFDSVKVKYKEIYG